MNYTHQQTHRHLALFRKGRLGLDRKGQVRRDQDRGLRDLGIYRFKDLGILGFRDFNRILMDFTRFYGILRDFKEF